jgi:hypothetical protein
VRGKATELLKIATTNKIFKRAIYITDLIRVLGWWGWQVQGRSTKDLQYFDMDSLTLEQRSSILHRRGC